MSNVTALPISDSQEPQGRKRDFCILGHDEYHAIRRRLERGDINVNSPMHHWYSYVLTDCEASPTERLKFTPFCFINSNDRQALVGTYEIAVGDSWVPPDEPGVKAWLLDLHGHQRAGGWTCVISPCPDEVLEFVTTPEPCKFIKNW